MSDLVKRLRDQAASDHVKGCSGRYYHCDCGFDLSNEGFLLMAADELERIRDETIEECARLVEECAASIRALKDKPEHKIETIRETIDQLRALKDKP